MITNSFILPEKMLRSQNFWQIIENGGCFNHLFGTGAPFGIQIQNNFSYSGLKLIYTTTLFSNFNILDQPLPS